MKIVYLLFFLMSSLQTLASSKNYVFIFTYFISGLSEIGFSKEVYQIFGKRRTFPLFQITIQVLRKRK